MVIAIPRRLCLALVLVGLAGSGLAHAQLSLTGLVTNQAATPAAPLPAPAGAPTNAAAANQVPITPQVQALREAVKLSSAGNLDAAIAKVNFVIQSDPKNIEAYNLRGSFFSKEKLWDQSEKDYETILQIDSANTVAKFNLSELKFMQKLYDAARPGFLAIEKDPDWGDLAAYKVFLCDLLGGHTDVAKQELDVFNQVGANPSFYFGNAAWELVQKKNPEGARPWLESAVKIYYAYKIENYASSLKELGYLPLPPTPQL